MALAMVLIGFFGFSVALIVVVAAATGALAVVFVVKPASTTTIGMCTPVKIISKKRREKWWRW